MEYKEIQQRYVTNDWKKKQLSDNFFVPKATNEKKKMGKN